MAKLLAGLAAFFAGVLIAAQSRVNGQLGSELGDGFGAALYSFLSGWIVVAIALALSEKARRGLRRVFELLKTKQLQLWVVIGGAFGGFLVMSQGLSAGLLGVSLFTVAVVAGQGISAIVIDSRGWFGVEKRALNFSRVLGAVLVLIGVAVLAETPNLSALALLILPFLAGLGLGFQQAVNGKVRISADSAIAATFINFAMGTLFLLILKLATLPTVGFAQSYPAQWWLYTGGLIGAVLIAIQVVTVSKIGVLGLGVLLGTGQLVGSVVIDLVFPMPGNVFSSMQLIGAGIALVGAVLVNLKKRAQS